MTATVTTWHRVKVFRSVIHDYDYPRWFAFCDAGGCYWSDISVGPGSWQAAVGKALAHVDETKEEA